MRRWLAGVVVGALMLAGCSPGGDGAAGPTVDPAAVECRQMVAGNGGRPVRFGVGGAGNLAGIVAGRGATGIVLAHGSGADMCIWTDEVHELVGQGYRVLAFDPQGYGDSQSRPETTMDDDVVAAAATLRADGARRIVLLGVSMGGTFCLAAAPRIQPPVTAVISASGPTVFAGVDAEGAVPRLTMPVLFVAEAGDGLLGEAAKTMYAEAKASSARVLKVPPGTDHGIQLVIPGGPPAVRATLEAFLRKHAPAG